MKLKGNELFKRGENESAVECYTQSLSLWPGVAAVHANRALCYLQLGKAREALADADKAIWIDPRFVKAYHRRAVARRRLGLLHEALADYQVAIKELPQNKQLHDEMASLRHKIARQNPQPSEKVKSTQKQELKPNPPSSSSSSLSSPPVPSTPPPNPPKKKEDSPPGAGNLGSTKKKGGAGPSEKSNNRGSESGARGGGRGSAGDGERTAERESSASTGAKKGAGAAAPAIPKKPRTALEFERACTLLQNHPDKLVEFIRGIDPSTFPSIFKESLSASMLASILGAVHHGLLATNPELAVPILRALTLVNRFKMTAMLLNFKDKAVAAAIFDTLEKKDGLSLTREALAALRKDYRV